MVTFTISVKNRSGSSQQYILFVSPPRVGGAINSEVFTNIYMTAPTVPSGNGSVRFSFTNNFYAICGTNPTPLGAPVQISTSDFEVVTLGDSKKTIQGTTARINVAHDIPQFDTSTIAPAGPSRSFQLITRQDFSYPNDNNIFIGLGGDSAAGQGDVIPLATILAHPSQIYTFTPVTKYYIGTGTYVAGEIIEIQDVGTVQLVNFTGTNPKNVVLTHNSNGSYSTKST